VYAYKTKKNIGKNVSCCETFLQFFILYASAAENSAMKGVKQLHETGQQSITKHCSN